MKVVLMEVPNRGLATICIKKHATVWKRASAGEKIETQSAPRQAITDHDVQVATAASMSLEEQASRSCALHALRHRACTVICCCFPRPCTSSQRSFPPAHCFSCTDTTRQPDLEFLTILSLHFHLTAHITIVLLRSFPYTPYISVGHRIAPLQSIHRIVSNDLTLVPGTRLPHFFTILRAPHDPIVVPCLPPLATLSSIPQDVSFFSNLSLSLSLSPGWRRPSAGSFVLESTRHSLSGQPIVNRPPCPLRSTRGRSPPTTSPRTT